MEQNYAVIEKGVVVNVIVWNGVTEIHLPEGQTLQPIGESGAWIGWKFNTKFEQPS